MDWQSGEYRSLQHLREPEIVELYLLVVLSKIQTEHEEMQLARPMPLLELQQVPYIC